MVREAGGRRNGWLGRATAARLVGVLAVMCTGFPLVACGDVVATESWSVEAWVCHVPGDTTSPWYAGLPARREVSAEWFAARIAARVPAYVEAVSGGRLRLDITTGGELTLGPDEGAEDCIARVVAESAASTRAVVVIADAEHAEGKPGGLGGELERGSTSTEASDGAVMSSAVMSTAVISSAGPTSAGSPGAVSPGVGYAYVGAADVAPSWGDDPPMDLVEHELGHALGWRHSGSSDDAYDSGLDVMSDSASPRLADPTRRDAPWPIAAHLLASGWIDASAVLVVDAVTGGSTSTILAPLSSQAGRRVVVLPVPGRDDVVLTIERRVPSGFDSHLTPGGLAVHRVEFDRGSSTMPVDPSRLDWGAVASLVPLVGAAPFTDLLGPGASLETDGWSIVVGDEGQVTVGLVSGS